MSARLNSTSLITGAMVFAIGRAFLAQDLIVKAQADPAPAAAPAEKANGKGDEQRTNKDDKAGKVANKAEVKANGGAAKARPDEKRRAGAPKPAPADAAKNAAQQQMRRQLVPVLKVELSFAVRAAQLNDEERLALVDAGKKWFDPFLTDYLKKLDPNQQNMLLQGGRMIWFGGQERAPENPRDAMRKGLKTVIMKAIPKAKADLYAAECDKRDVFLRQVGIENNVAQIDERVILSPDQRQKITALLNEKTAKNAKLQLEAFAMYGSMWAGVPDPNIFTELTPAQKAILDRLNITSGQVFIGGGMFGEAGAVIDDIDVGDAEAKPDDSGPADAFAPAEPFGG